MNNYSIILSPSTHQTCLTNLVEFKNRKISEIEDKNKTEDLKPYRNAISSIIHPVLEKFTLNCSKILEIRNSEKSLPVCHVPYSQIQKDQLQIASINEHGTLNLITNPPKNPTDLFNFAQGLNNLKSKKCGCVVSSDLFNGFNKTQMAKTLSELSSVVDDGGYLVHFSIGESTIDPVFDELMDSNLITVPDISGKVWKGLFVVEKSDFDEALKKLAQTNQETFDLLSTYASLTPSERKTFCVRSAQNDFNQLHWLAIQFQKMEFPLTRKVNFETSFQNLLKDSLKQNGFEIVVSETQKGVHVGKRDSSIHHKKNVNHYFKNRQIKIWSLKEFIPSGCVKESIRVHILVCKKTAIEPKIELPSLPIQKEIFHDGEVRNNHPEPKNEFISPPNSAVIPKGGEKKVGVTNSKMESQFSSLSTAKPKNAEKKGSDENSLKNRNIALQKSDKDFVERMLFNFEKDNHNKSRQMAHDDVWNTNKVIEKGTCIHHKAMENVVNPIIKKYADLSSALEIGCNNFPIREYLKDVNESVKDKIWLSEYKDAKVDYLRKAYPKAVCKLVDITNIGLKKSSKKTILMMDVLNIFSTKDTIKNIVQQLKKTLVVGGRVIHFSYEPLMPGELTYQLVDLSTMMFPIVNDHGGLIGVQIVNKEECLKRWNNFQFENSKIDNSFQEFMSLDPWYKLLFCTVNQATPILIQIAENFQKLECPIKQSIDFEKYITETLETTFQEAGFKILLSEEQEGTAFVNRTISHRPGYNNFEYRSDISKVRASYLPGIDPNLVCEKAKVKVLVCEKL